MSGSDLPPEPEDEAGPARGIEPEGASSGPPPPPDFGVVAKRPEEIPRPVIDYSAGPAWAPPALPPQRGLRPWALAAIIGAIVTVLVLVVVLVVVGIGSLVTLTGDPGEAAPTSDSPDSGESDPDQDDVDSGSDAGAVESALQAMLDEYKTARDNGSLWSQIPDTDFNHTALSAFLYLLTDMKVAANWGADTSDYLERADELEQKLLNQEPLGSDVTIKLSDRTFTYDGDTGEGGYTNN